MCLDISFHLAFMEFLAYFLCKKAISAQDFEPTRASPREFLLVSSLGEEAERSEL
jgi:hypothetical protein